MRSKKSRQIRVVAENGSGKFMHTFSQPESVLDLAKGWLKFPDVPYTFTISEGATKEAGHKPAESQ